MILSTSIVDRIAQGAELHWSLWPLLYEIDYCTAFGRCSTRHMILALVMHLSRVMPVFPLWAGWTLQFVGHPVCGLVNCTRVGSMAEEVSRRLHN